MHIDRTAARLMRFGVLAVLGTVAVIVGLIYDLPGVDPRERTLWRLVTVAGLVLLGGAALILVQDTLGAWLRDHFPTLERLDQIDAAARRLGLRSLAREDTDVRLPSAFVKNLRELVRVFEGTWRGVEVSVFDCSTAKNDPLSEYETHEDWTCVVLPVDDQRARIAISRETILDRVKGAVGWNDVQSGDQAFDRAFRISADREDDVRRLLDARVRSRLLEDMPKRVVFQLDGGRMLYCFPRVPIEERSHVLDMAKALRDALQGDHAL